MKLTLPKSIRAWTFWALGAVWTAFFVVVICGFLEALAAEAGWYLSPSAKVAAVLRFVSRFFAEPVVSAISGAILGLVSGFAGGLWVERRVKSQTRLARSCAPSVLGITNIDESDPATSLSFRYSDPDHLDHKSEALLTANRPLKDVVVTGRFAVLTHYVSKACWTWTPTKRLAESPSLVVGEVLEFPYIYRPSAKRGLGDDVSIFGRVHKIRTDNPEQGDHVKIELTVHHSDGVEVHHEVWQFRRGSDGHFSDKLDSWSMEYPDDRLTL